MRSQATILSSACAVNLSAGSAEAGNAYRARGDSRGRDLAEELPAIYGEQAAAVVVIFVSAEYAAGDWTRPERRAALARAVQERREYVLPARFDDTPLPGLQSDMVWVDLRRQTPLQFAAMIAAKLTALGIAASRPGAGQQQRSTARSARQMPGPQNLRLGQGPAEVSPRRGASGFPRWIAVLVAVTVLAVAGVVIWVVTAARGGPGQSSVVPGSATGGLTVQGSPWASTDNGHREDAFIPGGPIRYAFDVYNSTGETVSANVRVDAYWGTRDQREVNIFDTLFGVTIPPGRTIVRSAPAAVPRNALPGTYTEQADIADRANPADHTGQYGSFNVAGKTLLNVPYLTQPGTAQPGGKYDGAACVAMVLGSRSSPGQPAVGDVQGFIAASPGRGASGTARPVAGEELEYALEHHGVAEAAITQISLDEQGLPQAQMTEIAIAIKHGSPVIVFTDGKDLPAGHTGSRSYTGHWLVVVGFGFDPANGTQVLVNDPDDIPGHGGIKGQSISIGTFEQAMKDAASVPAAQQEPNHIAGIIVAR